MWDIIYIEIDRLSDVRYDKAEQILIAKSVVKIALLEFYFDPEFDRSINIVMNK
jgi:hypothetical protein